MISQAWQIGALTVGVAALLAAILSGLIFPSARTAPARYLRAAIAVGGIALGLWASRPYLAPRPVSAPAALPSAPAPVSARDLVGAAGAALEGCPYPSAPSVPDSARASLDEMKAARAAFAAYDAATNAYMQCVDSKVAGLAKQSAGVASEADLQALNDFGARAHNAALDQEKELVDQFNAQLRSYKDKHPN